jgi:hypothetical protein
MGSFQRAGAPQPKAQASQKEKDAVANRKLQRRNSDRSAMMSLSRLDAAALERRVNPLAGLRGGGSSGDGPVAGAAGGPPSGASGADDSSSTATRSSCVSHREVEDREHAMNFATSFIQFVKERQLL